MGDRDKIVAIGLLSQRDLDTLGAGFRNVFPVEDLPKFQDLLEAIDRVATEASPHGSSTGLCGRQA